MGVLNPWERYRDNWREIFKSYGISEKDQNLFWNNPLIFNLFESFLVYEVGRVDK